MYLIQLSMTRSLCLCLCLSAVVGVAQGALLSVSLPNTFVTPDQSSCVAMNQMPATLPQLTLSLSNNPSSEAATFATFWGGAIVKSGIEPYASLEITSVSKEYTFNAITPFDYAYGNNTNPNAQWCLEDDSVTSSLATATTIRSQYESLLVNNLNLTMNVAFMYTITMVNSVDSTGNVYSAQMVLALDGVSTVIGTIALSCSTANFNSRIFFDGTNPNDYEFAVLNNGSLGSFNDGLLNNFQCATVGCCAGGFWFVNLNTTAPQSPCQCPRPRLTNIAANGSMDISSYRLTVFHYLIALAVILMSC